VALACVATTTALAGSVQGAAGAAHAATAHTSVELILPDGPAPTISSVAAYVAGAANTGAAAGAGKATFTDLHVTRTVDAATAFLRKAVTTGKSLHGGIAVLVTQSTATGRTQTRLKITLGGVTVSSDQLSGSAGEALREMVAFHYTSIEIDSFPAAGGPSTTSCFDIQRNMMACPPPVAG
jgi:type VI secretion system secreted protein Hcp